MDAKTKRLGEAIGLIFESQTDDAPLREVRFGDPGVGILARIQYKTDLGGYKMTLRKSMSGGELLSSALHEIAHVVYGVGSTDPSIEKRCSDYADRWFGLWRGPVQSFIDGDPGPINDILKAEAWVKKQAAKQAGQNKRAWLYAQICRECNVKSIVWQPGRLLPVIEFYPSALKAFFDAALEAEVDRECAGDPDPARRAFVRKTLARRKVYLRMVRRLLDAGLLPAAA